MAAKKPGAAGLRKQPKAAKPDEEKTGLQIKSDSYEKVKSHTGKQSFDSGDEVAQLLRGKTVDEAAIIVKQMGTTMKYDNVDDIPNRWAHLNVGMQRMNMGNRLRGWLNKSTTHKLSGNKLVKA